MMEIKNEDLSLLDIDIYKTDQVCNKETTQSFKSQKKFHGFFFGILSALFLSISSIFIRKARLFTGSEQTAVRYSLQLTVMVIIIFINKLNLFGKKEERKLLIMRGAFGTLSLICLHYSIKFINPSDSVALLHTNVIFVSVLARVFLKERLNLAQVISLFLTIIGVLLISQPSFLIPITNLNNSCTNSNSSCGLIEGDRGLGVFTFIGISLSLFGAGCSAIVSILLKKLSTQKVHFSVTIVYASYFGLPLSLLVSLIVHLSVSESKHFGLSSDLPSLAWQIVFSLISASSGVLSQVLVNISLKYEEASKVSIIRSADLFFTFILQYFLLDISPNLMSTIGALVVFLATFLVMVYKMIDGRVLKKRNKGEMTIFEKIFLFKV